MCEQGANPIFERIFNECVYNQRDLISLLVGYCSIIIWIFAQTPQVFTNWKRNRAEATSKMFIILWIIGDLLSFIGGILTHQLMFQIYLPLYSMTIDTVLLLQAIFLRDGKEEEIVPLLGNSSSETTLTNSPILETRIFTRKTLSASVFTLFLLFGLQKLFWFLYETPESDIGTVISWISSSLYLISRIPQILHNYSRKTVQGLSIAMFIMAAMGNSTYVASILIKSLDKTFLLNSLPFLIGSGGTLILDFCIFFQYLYYTTKGY